MNRWTDNEYKHVLDAIETGVSVQHVIEIIMSKTGRSKNSVEKKLKKMGYLRCCGQTFSRKQGFVR